MLWRALRRGPIKVAALEEDDAGWRPRTSVSAADVGAVAAGFDEVAAVGTDEAVLDEARFIVVVADGEGATGLGRADGPLPPVVGDDAMG